MTVLSALLVLHHYVAAPPDGNAVVEAGDRRYQYEAPSEPLPEPERSWPGNPVASRAVLVTIGSAWPRSMVIDRRGTSSPSRSLREPGRTAGGSSGSTATDERVDKPALTTERTTRTEPGTARRSRTREVAGDSRAIPRRDPKQTAETRPLEVIATTRRSLRPGADRSTGWGASEATHPRSRPRPPDGLARPELDEDGSLHASEGHGSREEREQTSS